MKQRIGKRAAAFLLATAMTCSLVPAAVAVDQQDDETAAPGGALTVTLDQTKVDLEIGESAELTATVSGKDPKNLEYEWTVQNTGGSSENIVSVMQSNTQNHIAEIKAEREGMATITVTVKEKALPAPSNLSATPAVGTATCEVRVTRPDVTEIKVFPSDVVLDVKKTEKLKVIFTPSTATGEIAWRSGDESVAKVDQDGTVTGIKTGTTRIYARVGTRESSCQVNVRGIELKNPPTELKVGDKTRLEYITYGLGNDPGVSWSSDKPDVLRVTEGGHCFALAEGEANITAKVDGFSYEVTCKIVVKTNTAAVIKPNKPISPGTALHFSSLIDRIQTQCRNVLEKDLTYISGVSVATKEGTLYYQYRSDDDTGRGIAPSDTFYLNPSHGQETLSEVYFVPQPGFSGTATISYTGYAGPLSFFQGTIQVEVEEVDHIVYTVSDGVPLQFKADDFNIVCLNTTGRNLKHVVFTLPDSNRGSLYRNYISPANPGIPVRSGDTFQVNGIPSLSDLYFVPAPGYNGTVVLSYTAVDVNGASYRSRVEVQVSPKKPSGDINYTVSQGGTVSLNKEDFVRLCRDFTGGTLDYVRFSSPAASQGKLYFDYTSASKPGSAVTGSQSYYANGSPNLSKLTFAASDSGAGIAVIPFTGWDTKGNNFSGQVEIAVRASGAGDIRYNANSQGKVTFNGDDFNTLSKDLTGANLRYVQFTLPPENQGVLYYDSSNKSAGEKVTAGKKYYFSGSPNLDKITFVAASGFTGTATMSFTGWNTKDGSFTGTVEVQVDRNSAAADLHYTVRQGQSVTFNSGAFNTLCRQETEQDLSYVRFTLPSSSQGTLYYNYRDGNYESKVGADRSYYRTSSPSLDKVAFVPAGYLGTLSVYFDGWSTGGKKFSGTVKITVEENQDSVISYTTSYLPVRLQPEDFRRACQAQGVSDVSSVTLTPPSSTWGRLCYQYTSPLHYVSEVRPTTAYQLNGSPALSDVTFVPKADTRGTVSIPYVATGRNGRTCAGTVQITLQPSTTSWHFSDMGKHTWATSAVDYLYENNITTGMGGDRYQPAGAMRRGDFMVMLARGFGLKGTTSGSFPDVPADSYYADAVAAAKELGITNGYEDGTFRPQNTLSRQEAMVFLQRTLQASGWYIGNGSEATLAAYADGEKVSGFARGAVAAMVERGILYGSSNNRLNPWGALSRAEMAVLLHRTLTL